MKTAVKGHFSAIFGGIKRCGHGKTYRWNVKKGVAERCAAYRITSGLIDILRQGHSQAAGPHSGRFVVGRDHASTVGAWLAGHWFRAGWVGAFWFRGAKIM